MLASAQKFGSLSISLLEVCSFPHRNDHTMCLDLYFIAFFPESHRDNVLFGVTQNDI